MSIHDFFFLAKQEKESDVATLTGWRVRPTLSHAPIKSSTQLPLDNMFNPISCTY